MCGINGVFGLKEEVDKENIIQRMNLALIHRGPDAGDTYHDDYISFGHRRLSIIGLDETGTQPMKSLDDKVVLVFNGEIYNYKELKSLTPDYQYQSQTDTEVIIALYQAFGFERMLELIDGMFAIALWDKAKTKLYLARDRFGKKPLYYSILEDGNGSKQVAFSSEIRGLLASKLFTPKLNKDVLGEYLQIQCVREPNTLVNNVFQVKSGHLISLDAEDLKSNNKQIVFQKAFWELNRESEISDLGKDQAEQKFRDLLYGAVEKRLVSDVPLGAFLSGGLDSSAIVISMAEISSSPVRTVCIDSDSKGYYESNYADLIAKRYNTEHTNILLTSKAFFSEFEAAVDAMDHPSTDIFNSYIVSKHMKNVGVTVALNGTGGDEVLGGYKQFDTCYKWNSLFRNQILLSSLNGFTRLKLGKNFLSATKYKKWSKFLDFPYNDIIDFNLRLRSLNYSGEKVQNVQMRKGSDKFLYSSMTDMEMEYYLKPTLLKDIDNMSMAHSLEIRTPFLDPQLVEFCYSLPDALKSTPQPKQFLIDALKDKLPLEIQNRKKQGFSFPQSHWNNEKLKSLVIAGLEIVRKIDVLHMKSISLMRSKNHWTEREHVEARLLGILGHWIQNINIEIE